MDDIMQIHPNTYIIHQIRDPRGTVVSRYKGRRLIYDNPPFNGKPRMENRTKELVLEAKLLCAKIVDDIRERKELEEKYPGRFMQVKYEFLADEPMAALEDIYRHVNLPIPQEISDGVKEITNAKKNSGTVLCLTLSKI